METKTLKEIHNAGMMAKGIFGLLNVFGEMLMCETIFCELKLCQKYQKFNEEDCQKLFKMRVKKELNRCIFPCQEVKE